ncbi:unnamed protein product [Adineta ricciae]|uniref:Uncharacterized protein n=1 Tax=Adineta ricciae TaxID=249248 RepID=A0A813NQ71_ADIRI|nr:unnamed protein product [Adineta ricciae]
MCSVLQHLASLEHLAINCVPNQLLINAILSTPSIRVCHVDFLQALTELDPETQAISNIERFSITLRNDKHNSLINLFLNHMPKLQRLEIHSPEVYFDNRLSPFTMPLFRLPDLRVIKLNWSLIDLNSISLTIILRKISSKISSVIGGQLSNASHKARSPSTVIDLK